MLKKYRDMKIASKLIIGFIIVAVFAAAIGVFGSINISSMGTDIKMLYEDKTLGIKYIASAEVDYQRIRFNTIKGFAAAGTSAQEDSLSKIDDYVKQVEDGIKLYGSVVTDATDKQQYDTLQAQWNTYIQGANKAVDLMRSGKNDDAKALLFGDLQTDANNLQTTFDKMFDNNTADAQATADDNVKSAQTALILMISVAAAGIVIAVILGIAISRIISKPINLVTQDAERLALGDVEIASSSASVTKDEIGRLTASFVRMAEGQKDQVNKVQRLAEGDLTTDFKMKSDKDILNQSLIALVDNLNDLIVSIQSSADQVASGSNLVSNSSMALSQGATEQASSVEQLTASLQEIGSQTTLNAQNAETANQLAKSAKNNAETGNNQMQDMLSAMEEINRASASINKIIKVIDDIAFQTNILALNAAVEAARAGQHGKGFAVVAEEVRTLAARSAQAAKETTDMIEGSIRKVEVGTKIATDTASALSKIVGEVAKAAELVDEIASASNEQAAAVEQINQGVMQVSQVVQNNAATSEESAAASEELSSQAAQLRENVSVFRVKQGQTKMGTNIGYLDSGNKNAQVQKPAHSRPVIKGPKSSISIAEGDFGKY